MKKLILLLLLIPALMQAQTWIKVPSTNKNYWYPYLVKFTTVPFKCNNGGTVTDTLATKADVRANAGTGTSWETTARIDSLVTAISNTNPIYDEIQGLTGLPVPTLTAAQISAISSPDEGLLVIDGTNHVAVLRLNGAWVKLSTTTWP